MKYNELNIFKPENKLKVKKGRILLSEPLSLDSVFFRSMVLLTEHNDEGSIGYMLNKPTSYRLNQILSTNYSFNPIVHFGGPVQPDTLHFIHTLGEKLPGSKAVVDGLYWNGDFEIVKLIAEQNQLDDNKIRFFLGYSGWAPNQLEDELKRKFWLIENADINFIMTNRHPESWKNFLKMKGDKYKPWLNVPVNPTYN